MGAVRRRLVSSEEKAHALSDALEQQEGREAERERCTADAQRVMERQYDYLLKEYEERIHDMDSDRKKRDEEVH
jgi:hypothetical protein